MSFTERIAWNIDDPNVLTVAMPVSAGSRAGAGRMATARARTATNGRRQEGHRVVGVQDLETLATHVHRASSVREVVECQCCCMEGDVMFSRMREG